jgi:molybdopterin synthase sulfur carrier subunit
MQVLARFAHQRQYRWDRREKCNGCGDDEKGRGDAMPVTIRIPIPLRALTGRQGKVAVEAATIREMIDRLDEEHPGLKERLCEEDGSFRHFVNFYLNDEDIRFLQGVDTPLRDGDEVAIVPAIAGGARSSPEQGSRLLRA